MELETVVAIIAVGCAAAAAIAAFVALVPAWRAAQAAIAQTELQREVMRQSAQPYVWADIQPDTQVASMIHLVLGNSGPTVARNIRVTVDPPIPELGDASRWVLVVQKRLSDGVLSLAPGRTIRWLLGTASDFFADSNDQTIYRIVVTADGPFGAIEPTETQIRLSDWRESRDAPDGSLHHIRKEIQNLTAVVKQLATQ